MTTIDTVTRCTIADAERATFTHGLFGLYFPMRLEPAVYDMAAMLSPDYHGGFWLFHSLSNGGFYMAPDLDTPFHVQCENGFEGELSADALGITACLYAYSHLAFVQGSALAQTCAEQYHLVREFAMDHAEARGILAAID